LAQRPILPLERTAEEEQRAHAPAG
jgi:hypothetical protein